MNNNNPAVLSAIENYSRAKDAVTRHIEENPAVFKPHETLVGALITARGILEDTVIDKKEGATNGAITATYLPQKQKIYDEEKIKAALAANPALLAEVIKEVERPGRMQLSEQKA